MDREQIGKELEQPLLTRNPRQFVALPDSDSDGVEIMYLRYAVVGCCFVAAAILIVVSSNSYGGRTNAAIGPPDR